MFSLYIQHNTREDNMGSTIKILLTILLLFTITTTSFSQDDVVVAAPPPASDTCNGIFLTYVYTGGAKIQPTAANPKEQPYRFESILTVLNNGEEELKSWKAFVGFQHKEILVSASNAVVVEVGGLSASLPASVENGTVFAGFPMTDLKTGILTAGDLNQMQVQVMMVGTQFGVKSPAVPMPQTIKLANDGFSCPKPTFQGKSVMEVCCTKDDKLKTNITVDDKFLPRQNGDLTIMYDVTRTYDSSYWAQVTIENHNPLGRLDNWMLSFDWMRDEFIFSMKGAIPYALDSSGCITGPQGTYYAGIDFANVLNCERRPTIVDLPPTKYNDSTIGMVPGCCRNGTILPAHMDLSKSFSAFQMQVYKMPPNVNRSDLAPPQNWRINGTLNPDYKCGPPVRVSPSEYPDPSGLPANRTAFASWQVVCNITQPKGSSPRCCVSFSAFYNESIIPCKTCACGCANTRRTCSTTTPAMLIPPQALLLPFDNRTLTTLAWAELKHQRVPNPLPCGDNCGVSIHWHVNTDYRNGWSARVTMFNWGDISFADWFAAVEMDKAGPGFEAMYSFNATTMGADNNTIFMQGLPGLNYLVAEADGPNPLKDPRVPGKQQSVISFTKKTTPGINSRYEFPTKVFFNGEECSLPSVYPISNGHKQHLSLFSILMAIIVLMITQV